MARAPGSLAPLLLVVLVVGALALPSRRAPRDASPPGRPNFVGEGTNELATLILQGYVDTDKNLAMSPLGYSATLAILAEGAGGETRKQLEAALHLPEDRDDTRQAYRSVLERLREKNVVNKPELRNWFYVYKNHSVEPAYRDVLREYYLTDVKTVSRPQADMGFQEMGQDSEPAGETEVAPSPAVLAPAPVGAASEDAGTQPPGAALEEAMTLGAMKEGALIETALQEEQTRLAEEQTRNENDQQEGEGPVEQEQVQEEVKPQVEPAKDMEKAEQEPMVEQMKDEAKKEEAQAAEGAKPMAEEKPMAEDQQKEDGVQEQQEPSKAEEEAEAEAVPQEEGEMMVTSERRKQRELEEEALAVAGLAGAGGAGPNKPPQEDGQVAAPGASDSDLLSGLSGLSANALGSKAPSETTSRMLLFNGMYFRGSWRSPFVPLEQREAFYLAEGRKVSVPMMRTRGAFRVGNIPELDSVAVELPYEGDRYSLLVLLPNAAGGLRSLVADLAGYSLRNLYDSMASREVEVTLPCFSIETITRPIPVFSKVGVSDVFNAEKADLSGVSAAGGLFVQDLVQLVTVRVDNSSSALNQITSSSVESRTGNFEKICADKPFLYFVRDTLDNLVVVAGKVVNPEDRPATFRTFQILSST